MPQKRLDLFQKSLNLFLTRRREIFTKSDLIFTMKWGKTKGTAGILAVPHFLITKIRYFFAKCNSRLTVVKEMFHANGIAEMT